jgi:transposase-like protein
MRQKSVHPESSSERIVKTIPRATRKRHSSEEKIQIVLDGLRGESSIAELCRREGIAEGLYYTWSKEFLEAGKRRLRALAIATPVRIEELPTYLPLPSPATRVTRRSSGPGCLLRRKHRRI